MQNFTPVLSAWLSADRAVHSVAHWHCGPHTDTCTARRPLRKHSTMGTQWRCCYWALNPSLSHFKMFKWGHAGLTSQQKTVCMGVSVSGLHVSPCVWMAFPLKIKICTQDISSSYGGSRVRALHCDWRSQCDREWISPWALIMYTLLKAKVYSVPYKGTRY